MLSVAWILLAAGGQAGEGSAGCLVCHEGIEEMHPEARLSCVDCHGGDANASTKLEAHVQPREPRPADERVGAIDDDLPWRRFVNPMDLRVAERTCGECHEARVEDLFSSLHGTTAGHLSDGFYEIGLSKERGSLYSVFPISRGSEQGGEVDRLVQPPELTAQSAESLAAHYPDLARKECMQCHLWSRGRAVRGRVGFDGDYRGEGCAACHVPYGISGLSESADRASVRTEPGHPRRHEMKRAPGTETCTSCHYGDASIGLNFRGLAQLPPGAAGGPEIAGTTTAPLNRAFYLRDDSICPPDIHHERGMHCVDCHTVSDVMGDGKLHGQMEHAVEITCEACHGTFEAPSRLATERGTPLEHLWRDGDAVFLKGKVDGIVHPVKQVVHVLDPRHPDYDQEAAQAMTSVHAGVQCTTCHSAWNPNFMGFHFYRNEGLSQLDLLSGMRTSGRVTTQEKIFSTWKSFYAGFDERGKIAPYLTGFATMGTVDGPDGKRILDQVMPVTAENLSGLTMIHHQMHTIRPTARACVECHRSPAAWGLGSANFRLARELAFVADRRGIEVVALARGQLSASVPLAKIVLPDVIDIELDCDPLQGHARTLYASEGSRGIHVFDVRDPRAPRRLAFVESVGPRGITLAGHHLYVADGVGGLRIYDVSSPAEITRVGCVPMFDAHDVEVSWPWAYVADGPGGLAIVDVRAPIAPRVVSGFAAPAGTKGEGNAIDVAVLFQYSRPLAGPEGGVLGWRSDARHLCAVLDEEKGPFLVDVTEPTHPRRLWPRPTTTDPERTSVERRRGELSWRGLALLSHVDVAGPQGGDRTFERDYLYVLEERRLANGMSRSALQVLDVSEPKGPRQVARDEVGDATEMIVPAAFYNAPFLQQVLFVPGEEGVLATDVSVSEEPNQVGAFGAILSGYAVAVEEFPLDRMIDEDGVRLKDVSHDGARWLTRGEIERVLAVDGRSLGTIAPGEESPDYPGKSARVFFVRLDRDRDGILAGEEYEEAGGAQLDPDADGRITLDEMASVARSFGEEMVATVAGPGYLETRVDPDGDLSRLLDGIEPHAFDRDEDGRLDRKEMERAFFAALDLDDDDHLALAEVSRAPGDLRLIRFGDHRGTERFTRRDLSRGGLLPREFLLAEEDWRALDPDADGYVQLDVRVSRRDDRKGDVGPRVEWPSRRERVVPLPPLLSTERVLELFDRNRDMTLTNVELRSRGDLVYVLDQNDDGLVSRDEIDEGVGLILQRGVDACPDDWVGRWDLDGNGEVEEDEIPPAAHSVLRRADRAR